MTTGNAYDAPDREGLPDTWAASLDLFARSEFIGTWLGEGYRRVYAETKQYERHGSLKAMSPRSNGPGTDDPARTTTLDLCR